MRGGAEPRQELRALLDRLNVPEYPARIASRIGERVEFVDLSRVSHFFASDKLTYAATPGKNYAIDHTIQELEQKLDPRKFVRIHRATLVNLDSVYDLHAMFAGRMIVRLKDEKRTELAVSRDRVKALKQRLGI
ncbi:MAG TPA: LytTR family DNA-binding domain-containing protein, partial [Bryobacteraceae bacterium]|nr:LytTR family DNA-binding domain-containing protein [Bryobacteraceae bacterium]